MGDAQPDRQSRETSELIVLWTSSNRTRCVLAFGDDVLELRLEHDGKVLRRARFTDIRPASDAAQRWRIDWDIEARSLQPPPIRTLCPECGDDGLEEREAGTQRFRCPSCGEAWTVSGARKPRTTLRVIGPVLLCLAWVVGAGTPAAARTFDATPFVGYETSGSYQVETPTMVEGFRAAAARVYGAFFDYPLSGRVQAEFEWSYNPTTYSPENALTGQQGEPLRRPRVPETLLPRRETRFLTC